LPHKESPAFNNYTLGIKPLLNYPLRYYSHTKEWGEGKQYANEWGMVVLKKSLYESRWPVGCGLPAPSLDAGVIFKSFFLLRSKMATRTQPQTF
jgi:hypothetical protein